MAILFGTYPVLLKLRADAGYQGPKFRQGLVRVCRAENVEIVLRSEASKCGMLPKRWIVEHPIARLNRCRRLSRDWEYLNRSALAFPRWGPVRLMPRRLWQNKI